MGMVNNVIILLHAVSDTDNATSPLAIMEKMLDELPPGEQAMSMMPIKTKVRAGRHVLKQMPASAVG